ncbi:MAG TPA: hypothetical protein VFU15_16560 [Bacteroidia bacterium]|nr:hypothetical protein [Bacteroidia bacterium]
MKTIFLFFLVFPLALPAQLSKIKPGMKLDDARKQFPGMKPDYTGMTSWVYKKDTIGMIAGKATYKVMRDTVRSYNFLGDEVPGPCPGNAGADTADYSSFMQNVRRQAAFYTKIFGKPVLSMDGPGITSSELNYDVVFDFRWKFNGDELTMQVTRPKERTKPQVNGAADVHGCAQCCNYTLEIDVKGNGTGMKNPFCLGMTKNEFKKAHPEMSLQVNDYPDKWIMPDTLLTKDGLWRMDFEDGKLVAFNLSIYDGKIYGTDADAAYARLLGRAKELTKEAKKKYGKADSLMTDVPDKRPPVVTDSHGLMDRTDYKASWNVDGKVLVICINERAGGMGGGREPVFNLLVTYPFKEDHAGR